MYISRIRLREDAREHQEFWRLAQGEYGIHKLIWGLFSDGPGRERDFLYRKEEGRMPWFYAVSERTPTDENGLWDVEIREYAPRLREGQRLAFLLRANPVRTKRDEAGRQHRHDIVMEAKKQLEASGTPKADWPSQSQIVQEQASAWIEVRGERNGFTARPEDVHADGYRQHRLRKPKARHPVRFSTVELRGLLTVAEPERFRQVLFRGLGPAKGFGCGLMLVRPA